MLNIHLGFFKPRFGFNLSKFSQCYVSFLEPITSKPLIAIIKSDGYELINYDIFEAKNTVVTEFTLTIDHIQYTQLMQHVFSNLGSDTYIFKRKFDALAAIASTIITAPITPKLTIRTLHEYLTSVQKATYELA